MLQPQFIFVISIPKPDSAFSYSFKKTCTKFPHAC